MSSIRFPSQPTSSDQILSSITEMQKADADWRHGRLFSLIYHAESELDEVTKPRSERCQRHPAVLRGAAKRCREWAAVEVVGTAEAPDVGPVTLAGVGLAPGGVADHAD